jgi:uncharacterized protein YutE (UPF0331/DUF86 family)
LDCLASYRNRRVHSYHEISGEELYDICSQQLSDLETIRDAYGRWFNEHPEKIDSNL